jgi:hypothetical protein
MQNENTRWFTGKLEHEGLPLHLRFPEAVDFDKMASLYPKLVVITHQLEEVPSNGEPVSSYNESLEDFDCSIIDLFNELGHIVLIETFSGRRTYYGYISSEEELSKRRIDINDTHPEHSLEWQINDDKKAQFIKGYSQDYDFY